MVIKYYVSACLEKQDARRSNEPFLCTKGSVITAPFKNNFEQSIPANSDIHDVTNSHDIICSIPYI